MVHRSELVTPPSHKFENIDYDNIELKNVERAHGNDPLTQRLWKAIEQQVGEFENRMNGVSPPLPIAHKFPNEVKTLQTLTQAVRDLRMAHSFTMPIQPYVISASAVVSHPSPLVDEGHFPRDVDTLRSELAQCLVHLRGQRPK
jgi:hypothetical protein